MSLCTQTFTVPFHHNSDLFLLFHHCPYTPYIVLLFAKIEHTDTLRSFRSPHEEHQLVPDSRTGHFTRDVFHAHLLPFICESGVDPWDLLSWDRSLTLWPITAAIHFLLIHSFLGPSLVFGSHGTIMRTT